MSVRDNYYYNIFIKVGSYSDGTQMGKNPSFCTFKSV